MKERDEFFGWKFDDVWIYSKISYNLQDELSCSDLHRSAWDLFVSAFFDRETVRRQDKGGSSEVWSASQSARKLPG